MWSGGGGVQKELEEKLVDSCIAEARLLTPLSSASGADVQTLLSFLDALRGPDAPLKAQFAPSIVVKPKPKPNAAAFEAFKRSRAKSPAAAADH